MERIVYVNGEFVPEDQAKISIFDRGFLFADGVYEVSSVLNGKLVDNRAHLVRLRRSLSELAIKPPASDDEIVAIQNELITRNNLVEGIVYIQVTRGAPLKRDFAYPDNTVPGMVLFTQNAQLINNPAAKRGLSVISLPDIRWRRRDIKTVGLLAACMAKQAAIDMGADDAWFVENGYITEGSSNNAHIITRDGILVTRHLNNEILHGITRAAVLKLAEQENISVEERPFSLGEAHHAAEAFITSASTFVMPVIKIDEAIIGDGTPGQFSRRLRELYIEFAQP